MYCKKIVVISTYIDFQGPFLLLTNKLEQGTHTTRKIINGSAPLAFSIFVRINKVLK